MCVCAGISLDALLELEWNLNGRMVGAGTAVSRCQSRRAVGEEKEGGETGVDSFHALAQPGPLFLSAAWRRQFHPSCLPPVFASHDAAARAASIRNRDMARPLTGWVIVGHARHPLADEMR